MLVDSDDELEEVRDCEERGGMARKKVQGCEAMCSMSSPLLLRSLLCAHRAKRPYNLLVFVLEEL